MLGTSFALAAEPSGPLTPIVELDHDQVVDLAVTGVVGATALTTVLVRDEFQPGYCRWCDGDSLDISTGSMPSSGVRFPATDTGIQRQLTTESFLRRGSADDGGLLILAAAADRRTQGIVTMSSSQSNRRSPPSC